jgi:hypothetical protein
VGERASQIGTALVLGSFFVGAPAWAQEPGVTVDPNSPAGAEYALPLDNVRGNAAAGSGSGSAGSSGAQLFGVGIGRSGGGGSGPGAGGTGTTGDATRGGQAAHSKGSARSGGQPRSRGERASRHEQSGTSSASLSATPDAGSGTTLLVIAAGLAVVLAGVALGLLFRSRRVSYPGP